MFMIAKSAKMPVHCATRAMSSVAQGAQDVGILGMEAYFPRRFVAQEKLEVADGVGAGKYTKGLGQDAMAFTCDREDITSICLNAVERLLNNYNIDPAQVGRLEVGTETLVDKSKSTKTALMRLFGNNACIEGASVINACYGGTAGLLNSTAWVESSAWDGRYAIVVAADLAVYAKSNARPTGGAGAFAALIGPNAPLTMVPQTRVSHAADAYDFFKPRLMSEYPEVDGKHSQVCYLRAVDDCYFRHMDKVSRRSGSKGIITVEDAYANFVFHSPYNKLVQQSFGRLFFNDARRFARAGQPLPENLKPFEPFVNLADEDTYMNRDLFKVAGTVANEAYERMVGPTAKLSKQLGNTYTGAVFANLLNLICTRGDALNNNNVGIFSYGSGLIATMYGLQGRQPSKTTDNVRTWAQENGYSSPDGARGEQEFTLDRIKDTVNLDSRLNDRVEATPDEFSTAMDLREQFYGRNGVTPSGSVDHVWPGAWYLDGVQDNYHRVYNKRA